MSASDLLKTLAEPHMLVGYNHAPFYIGTWGPILVGEPVWYVQVALYEKHTSFGVLVIGEIYHATPSAKFNDGIQDATHQALTALCEEIRQGLHDKQVRRKDEKYIQKIEDLQDWDRAQERKIQDLQTLNDTQ
jgi:hypothetical protein